MVLPNTLLFPDALMPLFIFEPRYRAMVAWALENERMVCMALLRDGRDDWQSPEDFHHKAGIGLIRASVSHDDGTSHLILQGLARVELTAFPQTEPFVLAEFRMIPISDEPSEDVTILCTSVRKLCAELIERGVDIPDPLENQIAAAPDTGVLCDLVTQTLIRDPYQRQRLLEIENVAQRLHTLIGALRAELSS